MPVVVDRGDDPDGLDIGDTTVDADRGRGVRARRRSSSRWSRPGPTSPSSRGGIDVDQDVRLVPVDPLGDAVSPVDVDAVDSVHVKIPVFTDRQSRSLPVNPVVTGTPAAGFEIATRHRRPERRDRRGRRRPLAALDERRHRAGLGHRRVVGRRRRRRARRCPTGVVAARRPTTVDVTITLRAGRPRRGTSTSGLALVGRDSRPDATTLPTDRVAASRSAGRWPTSTGSTADPRRRSLDVADLAAGRARGAR